MKRVRFFEYQILKVIEKNIIVVSASDNEALIFIQKQRINIDKKRKVKGIKYVKLL